MHCMGGAMVPKNVSHVGAVTLDTAPFCCQATATGRVANPYKGMVGYAGTSRVAGKCLPQSSGEEAIA